MRKIVIFRDQEDSDGKKTRHTLRAIQPSLAWQGYSKNGNIIDKEVKDLCRYLEPRFTGYFLA
jgi:hypothetical protein